MSILKWATFGISLTVLVGCVVIPMNRTYYEPNPADGILIRSASCGWNTTTLDAIEKDVDGITLSLFPKYDPGRPLSVYILLGRTSKTVEIDPEKIEVRFDDGAGSVRPETSGVKDAGPYYSKKIDFVLPLWIDANNIAMTFLQGFIKLDGRDVRTLQFRFRRVTKSDVYYGSINC